MSQKSVYVGVALAALSLGACDDGGDESSGDSTTTTALLIDLGEEPSNPADLNGDGVVDGADMGILLGAWGTSGPGDLNGDGTVDGADVGLLLAAWS